MWRKGCPAGSSLFLKSVNSMAAPLRDGHHEKQREKMESVTIKRLIDNLCHLLANEVPCPGQYPYHQANSQSHPTNWSMLAFKITKMITLGLMTLRTDLMKLFSSPSSTSARYPPTCAGCPLAIGTRHDQLTMELGVVNSWTIAVFKVTFEGWLLIKRNPDFPKKFQRLYLIALLFRRKIRSVHTAILKTLIGKFSAKSCKIFQVNCESFWKGVT